MVDNGWPTPDGKTITPVLDVALSVIPDVSVTADAGALASSTSCSDEAALATPLPVECGVTASSCP